MLGSQQSHNLGTMSGKNQGLTPGQSNGSTIGSPIGINPGQTFRTKLSLLNGPMLGTTTIASSGGTDTGAVPGPMQGPFLGQSVASLKSTISSFLSVVHANSAANPTLLNTVHSSGGKFGFRSTWNQGGCIARFHSWNHDRSNGGRKGRSKHQWIAWHTERVKAGQNAWIHKWTDPRHCAWFANWQ